MCLINFVANNFGLAVESETNGDIRIQSTLPAVIPGVFSLNVHFIFNEAVIHQREIIHPSFKNTDKIDFLMSKEQLPTFNQFWVAVALKVDGVEGQVTSRSSRISEQKLIRMIRTYVLLQVIIRYLPMFTLVP